MQKSTTLSASDIPSEWRKALDEVRKVCPTAVLAGGSLRDLDHKVKPKDLDIFLPATELDEVLGINELIGGIDPDPDRGQMYPESMPEVVSVTDYNTKKNFLKLKVKQPVQFVYCNWSMEHILKRFDYGLCRIMFDGTDVLVSDEYLSDKGSKWFTLVRCESETALRSSVRRFARWHPRYPEHDWHLGCRIELGTLPIDFGVP